ncbi:MAG: tail fiber domain-containing protein [Acidobacteria bacterium]|nr:tail fiber domain-containing protein [Acidobacteriota bacterium]
MRIRWQVAALTAAGWALWGQAPAEAQSLGTFSWQLQPFCNVVTVNVVQTGGVYTLDGYDDQCGASQRAPLVGLATPNPDGTIGFGLHIVTAPGGLPVHVDARISLGSFGGPWTDNAGNTGTLVLGGTAAGSARPAPTTPGILPGSVTSAALAPEAVTSAAIADGAVGAAAIDSGQVQRRIASGCGPGLFFTGVLASGTPECGDGSSSFYGTSLGTGALAAGTGQHNTAVGSFALGETSTGGQNTAIGSKALLHSTTASLNVAVGFAALQNSTSGGNVGVGAVSLANQTTGEANVAVGQQAMLGNVASSNSVAVGHRALFGNTGGNNTAVGFEALLNATGGGNVAVGRSAGSLVTGGFNNIHIWHVGTATDDATIRIGAQGIQTTAFLAGVRGVTTATAAIPVLVGTDGQLGTVSSSRRYKFDIADMDDFSGRIAKLRPVTFRYQQPMDDGSTPLDFGLIAEEVAEVFPELAVTGADGQIETVAYHKLPALLLNELQKQQRVIEAQATRLAQLETLRDDVAALTAALLAARR